MACVCGLPCSSSSGGPEPPRRRRMLPPATATCSRVKSGKNMRHLFRCGQQGGQTHTDLQCLSAWCPRRRAPTQLSKCKSILAWVPAFSGMTLLQQMAAVVHAGDAAEGGAQLIAVRVAPSRSAAVADGRGNSAVPSKDVATAGENGPALVAFSPRSISRAQQCRVERRQRAQRTPPAASWRARDRGDRAAPARGRSPTGGRPCPTARARAGRRAASALASSAT